MKKIMNLLKKDQHGLTLVELLAVIVILAIIGPSLSFPLEKSQKTLAKTLMLLMLFN